MYAATLEYRFPIAKKVQGVVFTDMGSTWGIDEGKIPWYKDDNSLNFSVGVGLRLQTPIGPIHLIMGMVTEISSTLVSEHSFNHRIRRENDSFFTETGSCAGRRGAARMLCFSAA